MSVRAIACVAVLCSALVARADDADDARAHYETAQKLYDEGRYEEAIGEFEIAYQKKPHPNVLYNIGQAQERLLDYGRSVRAFERYLNEAAPDDPRKKIVENRLRVLRNLPARLSVTTIPEQVTAEIRDGKGAVIESARTPHVFSIPAGDYSLRLVEPAWETEEHAVRCDIGQPYFYQYRLERSSTPVTVTSDPSGARVFIDDRLVGETPWRGRLELGKHRLVLEYPDYPWHKDTLDTSSGAPITRHVRIDRPPRSGRTELVLGSMAFGGVVGPLLVGALSGSTQFTQSGTGVLTLLLSSVAGIGAGFAGSFLTTRNGIPVATSSLLIGGGAFGSGMGAALALGLQTSERGIYGITLLGGAVGITAAALVAQLGKVNSGDAAIVNSGGLWGTAGAALLAESITWNGGRPDVSKVGWFVLGGTALGIAAGAISAKLIDRSRAEVAIVDLGGLVGTALGFALGYAVGSNNGGSDPIAQGARFGLGGMVLGLVSGGFFARSWGKRFHPSKKHGALSFDVPQIRIEPVRAPEGEAVRVSLDLLNGRW